MNHDSSYKLLFSHARMIEDLLKGFVHEKWVAQLDFSSLEKVNGSYVSDNLRDREDDVVWRVKFRDQWLYVYLLLEFQSTVDAWMALRMLTYVGLLYQDLVRTKQLTVSGRLPPVLPIVLYNGERAWTASQEIAELIEPVPEGLGHYRPQMRYLLLDEGRIGPNELEGVQNLVAALFSLENSRTPEDVRLVVVSLINWLKAPEQASLRRAFTVWLGRVLLPGKVPDIPIDEFNDLQEVQSMLAERVKTWTEEWKRQGWQDGRREGRREGRQEAEQTMLKRQLIKRFGPLPDWAEHRLSQAGTDQLELWIDRILDAPTLEAVFDA